MVGWQHIVALIATLGGSALWRWLRAGPRPRLPHRVEPALRRVSTRAQLDAAIARGSAGRRPLAARSWTEERRVGDRVVRALQFNTLAHGLSALPGAPMPFAAEVPASSGGLDQVDQPEVTLDWSTRRWAVLAEVLRHDADLIALQEVDHFADFFQPALRIAGYDCLFQPVAPPGPGAKFGGYTDGVAVAWRRERFAPSRVNAMRSAAAGRASIVLTLSRRGLPGSRPLVLACTHLTAKCGRDKEAARARQIRALLADIDAARAAAGGGTPVVLLGDLNADPHDVSIPSAQEALAVPALRAHALESAYPLAAYEGAHSAGSGAWTTWKRRGALESKHQIDYIFFSAGGAACVSRLLPPSDREVGAARLPSPSYPSDHVAIAADLLIADL